MRSGPLLLLVLVLLSPTACLAAENADSWQTLFNGEDLEELWNEGSFTEGVAAGPDGAIYFSDIPSDDSPGRVLRFDPQTGRTSVHCPDSGKSNGLMFDARGRLLACCGANHGKQALVEITRDGRVRVLVDRFQGKKLNSPNDLVVHPRGSVYFSDPRYVGPEPMELDHMSVYRYDPDGSLHRVTRDIEKPNGVILSPDGKTLYVAETNNGSTGQSVAPSGEVRPGRMTLNAFPVRDNGSLGAKRVLVDFGDQLGIDGMTTDQEGRIYAAVRSAKRYGIVVYTPQGKEVAYIRTPELPTNCTFGIGEDAKTLYVTAGTGLYRIRLNASGAHPEFGTAARE
jgi:gluconolactonase